MPSGNGALLAWATLGRGCHTPAESGRVSHYWTVNVAEVNVDWYGTPAPTFRT
jgi:hypothetical protein